VPGGRGTDGWVFGGLALGDTVSVSGPYGRFVLKTEDDRHAILVGGGTGLAPLKSMIRHALEDGAYEGHLTLYQGARSREWLYDVEFLRSLAADFPEQFTYRPCLSEETADEVGADAAAYGYGMVTDVIAADHATLNGCAGYLCGPPPMVEAALKTLMGKRLFPRDIHREDFFNEGDKATGGVRSPLIKR
jgi:phenol/toluene 2-monooxygenase (NADH) P5/A5